ncbi:DUF554 domain-containing protein [Streptococcus sp. H49]|uniref:DUF554 domain-containing protein n=1 Tax=Streptococcus huangxiaojuni TaxID=3237239 RepID=UPI0034A190B1
MPTGVITNSLSVVLGGLLGGLIGNKFSENFKTQINLIFGVCSMGMGISSIGLMKYMPAVIFALVIGTGIGLALHLGDWINKGGALMQRSMAKLVPNSHSALSQEDYLASLLTIIVLFCASGTGIYGSLDAGITGDSTILISKSILDFFTAAIFACNLGYVVSLIAVPQFIILSCLFYLAVFIMPLTTPDMIADFKACGGFLMLATGFRIARLRMFPIADMIPAMVLVMPLSFIWVQFILPFL